MAAAQHSVIKTTKTESETVAFPQNLPKPTLTKFCNYNNNSYLPIMQLDFVMLFHDICSTMKYVTQHQQQQQQSFYGPLPRTTWVSQYQKKHSLTHTYPDYQSSFISFPYRLWSTASSLFNLCARQSFSTISLQVFFGLPLGLEPSTSYSIHFFTQSLSSFHNTCPYHCYLLLL